MSVAGFLFDFYHDERVVNAYLSAPNKYLTKSVPDGFIAYHIRDFYSIDLKLLAGSKKTMLDLLKPLESCNLFILVPSHLSTYLSDLLSLGFRVESGKDLLLLSRLGDIYG